MSESPPIFDDAFQSQLDELFRWRRDVRRFRDAPLADAIVVELLEIAALAPSVGNSQPWRFVLVECENRRERVRENFRTCNAEALAGYGEERAQRYASLKLAGLDRAPVHLAVFSDAETPHGYGLGQRTMPEALPYSVVGAIHTLWLAARARGVGLGWVSILDPEVVREALDLPEAWQLVGYLCLGYPEEEHVDPELVRAGWQDRIPAAELTLRK